MMTKAARYGTTDGTGFREERIDRLKAQIRHHILQLQDAAVLTRAWFEMAENVIAVGRFAVIESSAPIQIDKTLTDQAGRAQKGTLWDQERDEISVRVLLEEGKLNLALRVLQKYMQAAMKPDILASATKRLSLEASISDTRIVEVCCEFEIALGQLLRSAIRHVEVMQILDVPCLVQHCRDIIQQGLEMDSLGRLSEHQDGMQKSTVLFYLNSVAQHMEQLDEERVLEVFDANNILRILVQFIEKHHRGYLSETEVAEAIQFLVVVFNSESFSANAKTYETPELMKSLIDIKATILEPALAAATDAEYRCDLRRFLDRIRSHQRRMQYTPSK